MMRYDEIVFMVWKPGVHQFILGETHNKSPNFWPWVFHIYIYTYLFMHQLIQDFLNKNSNEISEINDFVSWNPLRELQISGISKR